MTGLLPLWTEGAQGQGQVTRWPQGTLSWGVFESLVKIEAW